MLVDGLLNAGYRDVTVADLSPAALELARARLGARASGVRWLAVDALDVALARHAFDAWHDRAVFHFLTEPADRAPQHDCPPVGAHASPQPVQIAGVSAVLTRPKSTPRC